MHLAIVTQVTVACRLKYLLFTQYFTQYFDFVWVTLILSHSPTFDYIQLHFI
jgi:hypothetical protein